MNFIFRLILFSAILSVLIVIYILFYTRAVRKKRKNGTLSIKNKIELCSSEMMVLLQKKYKNWNLQPDSLKSIDSLIDEKLTMYKHDELIDNHEFIFALASFIGEVFRYNASFKWNFDSLHNLYMVNSKDKIILPFELLKNRISNPENSLYDYYQNCIKSNEK